MRGDLGVEPDEQRLAGGVPCQRHGVYLLVALARQAPNTMRLADSVYFLGFLWTLYALIGVEFEAPVR